jgi:hypothetical protein
MYFTVGLCSICVSLALYAAVHHIGCHISEVPENGADVAHLNILHEPVHPVVCVIHHSECCSVDACSRIAELLCLILSSLQLVWAFVW